MQRARSKNSRLPPSAIYKWRPLTVPAIHLGRRMMTAQSASTLGDLSATRKRQSRHKLIIGNWNITSLRGKSTNWSRKPNDIPWMLLASFWQSVVVLTLLSWTMGGYSSTSALSRSVTVCPGWSGYACKPSAGKLC